MKPLDNKLYKGLIIALLHLLIVSSLGGKLLYDRATRPRVWARAMPYDPSLPIRGRYVSLRLEVEPRGFEEKPEEFNRYNSQNITLSEEDGKLIATSSETSTGIWIDLRAPQPESGSDPLGLLGITAINSVYPQLAEHLGIPGGILIVKITPGSPADKAGLREEDIILRVAEDTVDTRADFVKAFRRSQKNDGLPLTILRNHRERSLTVVVDAAAELPRATAPPTTAFLRPATLFFISEHVKDPSRREVGEELWVEVTLPKKGPPRPLRLGVKKDGGEIVPLDLD